MPTGCLSSGLLPRPLGGPACILALAYVVAAVGRGVTANVLVRAGQRITIIVSDLSGTRVAAIDVLSNTREQAALLRRTVILAVGVA